MKTKLLIILLLISCNSYSQIVGCYAKKDKSTSDVLFIENDSTYKQKFLTVDHIFIKQVEIGTYQIDGENIVFSVKYSGSDFNSLKKQQDELKRNAKIRGAKIIFYDKENKKYKKLRKTKCQQWRAFIG